MTDVATVAAAAMAMRSEDTLAWMPSPTQDGEWLQARAVTQGEDGNVELEALETGDKYSTTSDVRASPVRGATRHDAVQLQLTRSLTPLAGTQKLLLVNELPDDGVENMTQLNYLHEPALLDNLRHRFSKDHVYTYTGKICIAVNPFNWKVGCVRPLRQCARPRASPRAPCL